MTDAKRFQYRHTLCHRLLCHSVPDTAVMLPPDELRDGRAGCEDGSLYQPPAIGFHYWLPLPVSTIAYCICPFLWCKTFKGFAPCRLYRSSIFRCSLC